MRIESQAKFLVARPSAPRGCLSIHRALELIFAWPSGIVGRPGDGRSRRRRCSVRTHQTAIQIFSSHPKRSLVIGGHLAPALLARLVEYSRRPCNFL